MLCSSLMFACDTLSFRCFSFSRTSLSLCPYAIWMYSSRKKEMFLFCYYHFCILLLCRDECIVRSFVRNHTQLASCTLATIICTQYIYIYTSWERDAFSTQRKNSGMLSASVNAAHLAKYGQKITNRLGLCASLVWVLKTHSFLIHLGEAMMIQNAQFSATHIHLSSSNFNRFCCCCLTSKRELFVSLFSCTNFSLLCAQNLYLFSCLVVIREIRIVVKWFDIALLGHSLFLLDR